MTLVGVCVCGGGADPSAEMLSVYSTVQADCVYYTGVFEDIMIVDAKHGILEAISSYFIVCWLFSFLFFLRVCYTR